MWGLSFKNVDLQIKRWGLTIRHIPWSRLHNDALSITILDASLYTLLKSMINSNALLRKDIS